MAKVLVVLMVAVIVMTMGVGVGVARGSLVEEMRPLFDQLTDAEFQEALDVFLQEGQERTRRAANLGIGDSVVIEGVRITLAGVRYGLDMLGVDRIAILEVFLENGSEVPISVRHTLFEVYDGEGYKLKPNMLSGVRPLPSGINPGRSARGEIALTLGDTEVVEVAVNNFDWRDSSQSIFDIR